MTQHSNQRLEFYTTEPSFIHNKCRNMIKVPNELIPFWAKNGDNLYYKDGKFNRDL